MPVPCGTCAACLKTKAEGWYIRLENEMQNSENCFFVTLTYAEENLPRLTLEEEFVRGEIVNAIPTLYKKDCQDWIKRLRKRCKVGLKYYTVGEYGGKFGRPHYHSILFHVLPENIMKGSILAFMPTLINDTWGHGNITVEPVKGGAIRYVTNYVIETKYSKEWEYKDKPFALMSKGLGKNYIKDYEKYHSQDSSRFYTVGQGGIKRPLPRYYRDKLYPKFTRDVHAAKMQIESDKRRQKKKEKFEKRFDKQYEKYELEVNRDFEKQQDKLLIKKGKK